MFLATALVMLPAIPGGSAEKTYYFGASDRHATIRFESRALVGTIVGYSHKVSGSAAIDFEAGTGSTRLAVPVLSMTTGVAPIDNAMFMAAWLDAKRFQTIEFKADRAAPAGRPGTWRIEGQWTMRGITRDLAITAEVARVPEDLARKAGLGEGEWIRVRTRYVVRLSDHGIKVPEKSIFTVDDAWTVTVDLLGTTAKPGEAAGPLRADDGMPRVVRAEKVEAPAGVGKLYKLGKKPQFTNIVAESSSDGGTVLALSKIVGGYLVVDPDKGVGRVKLSSPVKALNTGIEELDKLIQGPDLLEGGKFPHLRFESGRVSRKDEKTWLVEGGLEIRGVSRPVGFEAVMRKATAAQMEQSNWGEKEALGFAASFRIRLGEWGVAGPWGGEWSLMVDLLAEAEE